MADTEEGMAGETQATESSDSGGPEIMDSGASSGSGGGAATDFPKVEPLNAAENDAKTDFLPDPNDQTLPGEEKDS